MRSHLLAAPEGRWRDLIQILSKQAIPIHNVTPAKAGVHPEMFSASESVSDYLRMDSGLRRNDTVVTHPK